MSFNAIRENKNLAKIFRFTVQCRYRRIYLFIGASEKDRKPLKLDFVYFLYLGKGEYFEGLKQTKYNPTFSCHLAAFVAF